MTKLTRSQKAYLKVMPDWSARYEILQRLGRTATFQSNGLLLKALDKLERDGLIEFGRPNATYRITPAGRAALAKEGE